jgi:hypothetical protein
MAVLKKAMATAAARAAPTNAKRAHSDKAATPVGSKSVWLRATVSRHA